MISVPICDQAGPLGRQVRWPGPVYAVSLDIPGSGGVIFPVWCRETLERMHGAEHIVEHRARELETWGESC